MTGQLAEQIDELARRERFSGVVRVERDGVLVVDAAFGMADRAHDVPNQPDTVFAVASITKGFTALTVMRCVEQGLLALDTTARSLLGPDLPLIADDVTVEHLLAHRSGIGDYFDEAAAESIDSYVLTVPVHRLDCLEAYLPALGGRPTVAPAGEQFAYCNSGFVLLALLAERASGTPYAALVDELVVRPARMTHTAFLRSDTTPSNVARCYLDADTLRTNVLHMPLIGGGDGGVHTTTTDLHRLWHALFDGKVLGLDTLALMTEPRSTLASGNARYGLGCWLGATTDTVEWEGYDAGISARTSYQPSTRTICTVLSNTSHGTWPIARFAAAALGL